MSMQYGSARTHDDWQKVVKKWGQSKQTKPNGRTGLVTAHTRSIKLIDDQINRHISAIDQLWAKHRMNPRDQKIREAITLLESKLGKLYATKKKAIKHRLAVADDIITYGASGIKDDDYKTWLTIFNNQFQKKNFNSSTVVVVSASSNYRRFLNQLRTTTHASAARFQPPQR